jgi:hypothetical protein
MPDMFIAIRFILGSWGPYITVRCNRLHITTLRLILYRYENTKLITVQVK